MKKLTNTIVILLLAFGCRDKYVPPISSPATGYLVVEGFINFGPEPTTISLSRTTRLVDSVDIIKEHNAQVIIESNDGQQFFLTETGNGVYTSGSLSLDNASQYRLHIITQEGKDYGSDFSEVRSTPPIDSISWQRDNAGVHLFINTHDAQNNTRYYQWQYNETWEIHSAYYSTLKYFDNPLRVYYRDPLSFAPDTTIFKCWQHANSTGILIGSTEKLTTDKIFLPLINIPIGSRKLSVLYSIELVQHAVSVTNYRFLQNMKKNTEQLGSIFDAQPSELSGNIHCSTVPGEKVIGFVEVSQEQRQRIFISYDQVPGWSYNSGCTETLIDNIPDSIAKYGGGTIPTNVSQATFGGIASFYASAAQCVDCTLSGTNVRPPFWP